MTTIIIFNLLRIRRTHSVSMSTASWPLSLFSNYTHIWRAQYKLKNYTHFTYTVMSMITHRYKQSHK